MKNYYKTDKGIMTEELCCWFRNPRNRYCGSSSFFSFNTVLKSPNTTDEHPYCSTQDFLNHFFSKRQNNLLFYATEKDNYVDVNGGGRNFCELLQKFAYKKGYILLPVWQRIVDGKVQYSTTPSSPFYHPSLSPDGSHAIVIGVIFTKREQKRNMGLTDTRTTEQLMKEVREQQDFLNTAVFHYTLYEKDGNISEYDGNITDWKDLEEHFGLSFCFPTDEFKN